MTKVPGRAGWPLTVSGRRPAGHFTPMRWRAGMMSARMLALIQKAA